MDVLSQSAIDALARTLGHFVWQGAAIALLAVIAFRAFRSSPNARYLVGVMGLAAMLVTPIVTFVMIAGGPSTSPFFAQAESASATSAPSLAEQVSNAAIAAITRPLQIDWMVVTVVLWMAGAIGFTLRLAGGWVVARRYAKRAVEPASEHLTLLVHEMAMRMNIRRVMSIVQSSAVSVPVIVGWLRPTIVLPIATLSNLTPAQVEALIAHELAHVRRHDYFVNILQSTVEALLFYHPAVWWLSRQVRAERELCCDDLAITVCDRLVYATALTDLAAMTSPGIALAATDGDLLGRVRRILGRGESSTTSRPGAIPIMAIAIVAAFLVPVAFASVTQQHPVTSSHAAIAPATHVAMHPQTTPSPSPKPKTVLKEQDQHKEVLKKHLEEFQKVAEEFDKSKEHLKAEYDKHIKEARFEEHAKQAKVEQGVRKADADARAAEAAAQIDRMKSLYEKGLVSEAAFRELQAKLADLQAQQAGAHVAEIAASARLRQATMDLERVKALLDKGLVSAAQVAQVERALAELQLSQHMTSENLKAAQAKQADARALHEAVQAHQAAAANERAAQSREYLKSAVNVHLEYMAPTAQVQTGDIVALTIAGEPDLPPTYKIAQDGTIRVPFVGSVKVAGLNSSQIRDSIGKALSDKKLGSTSQVTVRTARGK